MSLWRTGFAGFFCGFYGSTAAARGYGVAASRAAGYTSTAIFGGIGFLSPNPYITVGMIGYVSGVFAAQLMISMVGESAHSSPSTILQRV